MVQTKSQKPLTRLAGLAMTLAAVAVITALAPIEQTLGANIRIVYFHGAWVWAGMITFGLAALAGLAGLFLPESAWPEWSLALGRSGLFFWLTYLPMSLWVMRLFWGGFYFDEPRWRIPFTFAIVAVLLQIGLAVIDQPRLTSLGNLVFGVALLVSLRTAGNILHPDSPVFSSNSIRIRVFFVGLVALSMLFSAQLAAWLRRKTTANR